MNKLSKDKRDKLIAVALGTVGILAGLYFLIISAQTTALNEHAEKTEAAKEKLAKAERWLRMAPTIQSRLEANRKELDVKQDGMAPVDKFKWFYNTLDQSLAEHQVKLADITREPEIGEVGVLPSFPYQSATFGVKVTARFHDFGTFLADFENQFPYMRVKNLQIEPEGVSQLGAKDGTVADGRERTPDTLAISLRVVTLIKPTAPL